MLDTGAVRCWGFNRYGALGYGHTNNIGDDELPSAAGDVDVGGNVIQITAFNLFTCALLDTGAVRCWGFNGLGQLGYRHTNDIGDDEVPSSAGDIDVGGRVVQIDAGTTHTCVVLDTGAVRCWGGGTSADAGALGYGNRNPIGDNESPWVAGDVPFLP